MRRLLLIVVMVTTFCATVPGEASSLCDEVRLVRATSTPDAIVLDCDGPLELTTTINIHGNVTIVGVGTPRVTITGNNEVGTLFHVHDGASLTLHNITLADSSRFGVLMAPGGVLNVSNSIFTGHGASSGDGAAIWNDNGSVTVNNTAFEDNHSYDDGAAILNWHEGQLTVTNSLFRNNSAGVEQDGTGAGIRNHGQATITGSTFTGNENVHNRGAAIANHDNGRLSIIDSRFINNRAERGGAAIYNAGDTSIVFVYGSVFEDNVSVQDGAGIWNSGTVALQNTTLFANTSNCYNTGIITDFGGNSQSGNQSCGPDILMTGGRFMMPDGYLCRVMLPMDPGTSVVVRQSPDSDGIEMGVLPPEITAYTLDQQYFNDRNELWWNIVYDDAGTEVRGWVKVMAQLDEIDECPSISFTAENPAVRLMGQIRTVLDTETGSTQPIVDFSWEPRVWTDTGLDCGSRAGTTRSIEGLAWSITLADGSIYEIHSDLDGEIILICN